jgi:uncharacterized RDD family membrane protein YckC
MQARVRSASQSANGNQLTLARERRRSKAARFSWSPAFVPARTLAAGVVRDPPTTIGWMHDGADDKGTCGGWIKTERMTTGLTNRLSGRDPDDEEGLCATNAVETAVSFSTAGSSHVIEVAPPSVGPDTDASGGVDSNRDDRNAVDSKIDAGADPAPADSWRVEVAARLERYRTRRKPRTPRYPSLLLPFDAPESWSRPARQSGSGTRATALERNAKGCHAEPAPFADDIREPLFPSKPVWEPASEPLARRSPEPSAPAAGNVIEFPRSAAIPVFRPNDLADPVFDCDRPRIVEAPEILPPPPALGGMLIEPAERELADHKDGAESPFASASIARRALSALVDAAILAAALTGFAAIFFRLNPVREPLPVFAAALGITAMALWAAYEFLFVVYTGSTPGLRAARVQLARFDGSPLTRRLRRWRVLASLLSALSVGLGYLWCFLDQDGLCWHDRITRTHVRCAAHPTALSMKG